MIKLHERLSEFSYGYGATREAEQLLAMTGISTAPFLPSLLHEAELGFDVAFDRPGVPLLLQFKLGQSLTRFVRKDLTVPPPDLDRPFWRYEVNTAEIDGQFQMLLKAEEDGAEVYYVAPRFSDWTDYIDYYKRGSVLENSLLTSPVDIRRALDSVRAADGPHRVVYDQYRSHVCSRPASVDETRSRVFGEVTQSKIIERGQSVSSLVKEIWSGLDRVVKVRRVDSGTSEAENGLYISHEERRTLEAVRRQRSSLLEDFRSRALSEDAAFALALGFEFWGLGAQLVFATINE